MRLTKGRGGGWLSWRGSIEYSVMAMRKTWSGRGGGGRFGSVRKFTEESFAAVQPRALMSLLYSSRLFGHMHVQLGAEPPPPPSPLPTSPSTTPSGANDDQGQRQSISETSRVAASEITTS